MLDGKFCAPCQKKGHLCPAATFQDGIGLCAFCQDEEECPVSKREKEVAARFGKAAAGRAAAAVAPETEKVLRGTKEVKEEKTMEVERVCSTEGCGKKLTRANTSGRCTKHWYVRKTERQDPSQTSVTRVPPRKPVSKPRATQKPLTRAAAAGSNGDGVATISVPESALDQFWASRSLDEKAHLFTEFLTGAK